MRTLMFTYKILRKENSGVLFVRIVKNRRKAEFTLGVAMSQKEYDDAMLLSTTASTQRQARYIRSLTDKLDAMQLDMVQYGLDKNMDASSLRDRIKAEILFLPDEEEESEKEKAKRELFMPFFRQRIDSKTNEGYKESQEYTYKKITEFADDANRLKFADIDLKWLNRFDEWLVGKGLSQNTRNIHFKNIRTIINRAIDEELTDKYPFRRFKIKPEATRKRSLTVEELRKLFTCEVEPYQEMYRDMFKLIFMLIGINAVDLFNLKEVTSSGRVEYRRAKTHRLYSIKVEPEAMELIKKYPGTSGLLSISDRWTSHKDFIKWTNKGLQKIGEMKIVGRGGKKKITSFWPDITTYWARHTWATIAYNDLDIPKDVISQALGHSMGSGITEIYLDRDQRKVDEANRRVLDWVLYGKK